ncbi:hypothetical protein [Streptosporangium sp. NPDC003464]
MTVISDGVYRIQFTSEQLLTAPGNAPGAPICLLCPDPDLTQTWQVRSVGDGRHTIRAADSQLYLSFDGEPDMHETALTQTEPRPWKLRPTQEADSFAIAVPDTDMRLGLSLLRIFPPRVALAPDYGDPYQAWTFTKAK